MAEVNFDFTYDGSTLAGGEMAVRDLAPALLALGELFTAASATVYPGRPPIGVNIKATSEGSFSLRLALESKEAWDVFIDTAGSYGVSALANLYQIVGGTFGLFAFIKVRKRIKSTDESAQSGQVKITLDDDVTIEFPAEVLNLYRRVEIRRKALEVVAPLRRDGVEEARFSYSDKTVGVVVRKEDVPAYDIDAAEDNTLQDVEQVGFVEIISPHFQEGKKWRVGLGEHLAISATIDDPDFLARIDQGEAFAKGDFLRCRMRVIQTRKATGGLHTEYSIIEVLEHLGRPEDEQLEIGGDDAT